ncbi:MAG: class I SAM-dependent methyltransferase [Gammaproteobacteria bacterium]|nr:MAG: class I SAM-dependent methyltransferase [Gammaproteobacteria bacterium]UCH38757.1 MAG: class I SAM-dependent methyltransferase [Gammaproteobacteria bacterium]
MTAKVDSREVGLVAGLNVLNFFLGTRDLHYGLWQDDLEVCIQNLPEAQRRYSDFLISHIPDGVSRILDVGCGAGGLASELRQRGYIVEGVSPSPLLSEAARQQAGADFKIHQGRFEDVSFDDNDKFDLVMFSESFQYITLDSVLDNAKRRLNPGGYILICDFFKTGAPGRSVIGGGHPIRKFMVALERSGLEVLADEDITRETAPNLDIVDQMGRELFYPTFKLIGYTFDSNHPWLSKLFRWKYKKKLRKINRKYLSGERHGDNFARHKVYRLLLLRVAGK